MTRAAKMVVFGAMLAVALYLVVQIVLVFWFKILAVALAFYGVRVALVHAGVKQRRRRRPKSSWAKLLEAWSLLLVAWNTRGLVQPLPGRSGFRSNAPTRRLLRREPDDDGVPF